MFLIFDTETTGLPQDKQAPITDFDNWPRAVQVAWQFHGPDGTLLEKANHIIRPDGFTIPFNAARVHGITTERAQREGSGLKEVLEEFQQVLSRAACLVGHNTEFDTRILGAEYLRKGMAADIMNAAMVDTCTETTAAFCQLPGGRGGRFKLPNLGELHQRLFGESFGNAHNALADVDATARCFFELIRIRVIKAAELKQDDEFINDFIRANPEPIQPFLSKSQEEKGSFEAETDTSSIQDDTSAAEPLTELISAFSHLRNHSTYSVLMSTTEIEALVEKAASFGMKEVGLTDTSNLMGAFHFVNAVDSYNNKETEIAAKTGREPKLMKPVLGCEIYVCRDHTDKSTKDNGALVPLIAKNKIGFTNLSLLSSNSFTDGFYYVPRIDKELLLQHREGLIATTGGLSGEVPYLLLNVGENQAEEALMWWKDHFGDDFYIELNRHGLEEEDHLNEFLLQMAKKHRIKYFASNNTFYLSQDDADAHDFLLCIRDNARKSDPIGKGYGYRFGFPNDSFYFKSPDEMVRLFSDLPESILTISEISAKIEPIVLKREVMLPEFEIPEDFKVAEDQTDHGKRGENNYLKHLAYEGATKRYGMLTEEITNRLDFELDTIERTGYPGYFLIVQDLIAAAKKMGVWVGPGRGSAAGSLVAYSIGITNVDPLKYGLLFERFLNPERVSLPDIDIDFDDEGRSRVIDYVTNKYGRNKVAQIITYGTLGTKSAIRDIGRALDVDLAVVNKLAASTLNIKLGDFFELNNEKLKEKYRPEQIEAGNSLKMTMLKDSIESRILKSTIKIEGLVRNTGIHACGFVITPSDLRELVPVTMPKDSTLWATQFDNSVAEPAGLLKMDFLGLKTLSLIRDTIELVKQRHGTLINPDEIPLDDVKTFELFLHGDTIGIFQYESPGMQKHLKELKPNAFNDLIAMNALYRPGPMQYIPNYIRRKNGLEKVSYDLDVTREILEETFGITVYQEQVMLLSQKLSGFSKGQADSLRKAMGKKNKDTLIKLYSEFMEGGKANNHPEQILEKIWNDWIAFANYAFNKSHSTCYAVIGFQTAYLKAHYPAEFMASVLSNNIGDIKQVTFFMEECRRMGLTILGPDINESDYRFIVNAKGEIRFGLGAIKNLGEAVVAGILEERSQNGIFRNVFDFLSRINLKAFNKRSIESMAMAGAFDSFEGIHRAQFFFREASETVTFAEKAIRYAAQLQESKQSAQINLFGEESKVQLAEISFPQCEPWSRTRELQAELETIGFYVSSHPLDSYKIQIQFFTNSNIPQVLNEQEYVNGRKYVFAAQVVSSEHLTSQQGKPYGRVKLEDQQSTIDFMVFSETYLKCKHLLDAGTFLMVTVLIQTSFREKDKLEPRVAEMELLDKVLTNHTKEVNLTLRTDLMDADSMQSLVDLILDNEGRFSYSVTLIDHELSLKTRLHSTKKGIDIEQLIPKLEQFDWLSIDLK
jgi:DNA polymerase-3 subunit alpha